MNAGRRPLHWRMPRCGCRTSNLLPFRSMGGGTTRCDQQNESDPAQGKSQTLRNQISCIPVPQTEHKCNSGTTYPEIPQLGGR
eukprot:4059202-Amphidinium_carterae.1